MNLLPSILYVDDEEINLRLFKHTFQREYRVYTALTGEDGLSILEREDIDLVVTDQRMPGMSGVEFLERVLSLKPEPNRILITAYSDFNAVTNAVNKGKIFQYISKPWKKDEIKPILDQAVEIYHLRKENRKLTEDLKTELHEKENLLQKLNIALQKAEESDRMKTSFLRNISHEIRTPMNAILGFSSILENQFEGETGVYAGIIQKSVDELLKKIENIIEFAQLQTETSPPVFERFNVLDLITESFNRFKNNQFASKPEITPDLSQITETYIFSDFAKLQSILVKAIDNAFKFSEKGIIKIYNTIEENGVSIFIEDQGIGIEKDQLTRVFDSFYKFSDDTKVFDGLGLGLAIAKKHAEDLNCFINLETKAEGGCVFVLKIEKEK